jgi:hypothetical protein
MTDEPPRRIPCRGFIRRFGCSAARHLQLHDAALH